jgi:hypothetical protein
MASTFSNFTQATGAQRDSRKKMFDAGNNIMIAGLVFQVITLLVFVVLAVDFAFRTKRSRIVSHSRDEGLLASLPFRGMLAALTLSTFCIFVRCVFRVAELSGGWSGPIMGRQDLFIGLEGVMISVAVLAMVLFHPNLCFRDMPSYKKMNTPGGKGGDVSLGFLSGTSSGELGKGGARSYVADA